MPFRLTEEQWAAVKRRIEDLRGYEAADHVRGAIEGYVTRAFIDPPANDELTVALSKAAKTAREFSIAIQQLAKIEHVIAANATAHDCMTAALAEQNSASRSKIAQLLLRQQEALEQELSWRSGRDDGKKPGRPPDKALEFLCLRLMETAKHERWIITDDRGRTSGVLIELVADIVRYAHVAGVTHGRRDHRSFARAVTQARREREAASRASAQLNKELDALAHAEP